MIAMTVHEWFDDNVKDVLWSGHKDNRAIMLKENNDSALLINKSDVIALAKEFGLVVYEKDASL